MLCCVGTSNFTRFPGGCFLLVPPTTNTTPQQTSPASVMLCCQPAIDLFCRGRNRTASTALQAANGIPASISLRHFFFAITEKWLYFEMIGLPGSPKGFPHHKRNSFCSLAKPIDIETLNKCTSVQWLKLLKTVRCLE